MYNKKGVDERENGSGPNSSVGDDRLRNPRQLAIRDLSGQMRRQQSTNPLGQQSGYGQYDLNKQLELLHKYESNTKPIVVDSQQTLNQTTTPKIQDQILAEQQLMQQMQQRKQAQKPPLRSPIKYKLGMANKRLMQFMYLQRKRPEDNNIEFWKKIVAQFFTTDARKKWCSSMPGQGHQPTGVGLQEEWQCEICYQKLGKAFGANVEVLPRLFQLEYEGGMLEKRLYIDDPNEYQNSAGQIIVDYPKATEQSVFNQHRFVCDGHLRIVFSTEFKICSWEFCVRSHDELISRKSLMPQVNQLRAASEQYQAANELYQAASAQGQNASLSELQSYCEGVVASAKQLKKAVDWPITSNQGNSRRAFRVLEMAEVMDSMKDVMDYSLRNGIGPMESLAKFPRRPSTQSEQIMVPNSIAGMQQVNPTDGVFQNQMNSMSSRPQNLSATTTDSLYSNPISSLYAPRNPHIISFQEQKALSDTVVEDLMPDSEFSDILSSWFNSDQQI